MTKRERKEAIHWLRSLTFSEWLRIVEKHLPDVRPFNDELTDEQKFFLHNAETVEMEDDEFVNWNKIVSEHLLMWNEFQKQHARAAYQ